MNRARIELHFLAKKGSWSLERIHFHPRGGEDGIETIRADRFGRVGTTFAWTRALRALALLLVRAAAQPDEPASLRGGRNSPAQTLFNLLDHPERSAAAAAFSDTAGTCHLKSLLECANAGTTSGGDTSRQIFLNPQRLQGADITVLNGTATPLAAARLHEIATSLAAAWPDDPGPATPLPPIEIELARFSSPSHPLFGREADLARMTSAVADHRVVALAGSGGSGKTALVQHWLAAIRESRNPPFTRIFAWSFAEQNRSADLTMAAGECFDALLEFCGTTPTPGRSTYRRGAEAARAAACEPTLVILDGVETLQVPTGPNLGNPHDPSLRGFLDEARSAAQLTCLLTTRLEPRPPAIPFTFRIGPLRPTACRQILDHHQIVGPDSEIDRLVEFSHGHALTLHLIGGYLARSHNGNARALAEETFWLDSDDGTASEAAAIMASHEQRLAHTSQAALLFLLSLFDHPITPDQLYDFVFHGPALPDISRRFTNPAQIRTLLRDLEAHDLLSIDQQIHVHPLVASHFRAAFHRQFPAAHRAAHDFLYEQVINDPAIPHHPAVSHDYERLLRAFTHAREAGRLAECWREIAWRRIMRSGREYHMTAHLGEFHLCLRTWAAFWKTPWEELHPDLPREAHPIIQASAGFALFMIERVDEGERIVRRAMRNSLQSTRPHHALQPAAVLGYIRLRQGRFAEARRCLAPAATLARWVGPHTETPEHVLLAPICHLADACHRLGQTRRARTLFDYAITQFKGQTHLPLPAPLTITHWSFLIETGQLDRFAAIPREHLEAVHAVPLLQQIGAIPQLTARHALARWHRSRHPADLDAADHASANACHLSATNGRNLFHCPNLVTRAEVQLATGDHTAATTHLAQARQIATDLGLQHELDRIAQLSGKEIRKTGPTFSASTTR